MPRDANLPLFPRFGSRRVALRRLVSFCFWSHKRQFRYSQFGNNTNKKMYRQNRTSFSVLSVCLVVFLAVILPQQPLGLVASQGVIKIGASLSLTPPNTNRAITGIGIKKGLEVFKEWANERGPIAAGGQRYTFDLEILDDRGDETTLVNNYRTLNANPTVNFLVGPVASDFNIAAATQVTEPAGRILVAYVSTIKFRAATPFFDHKLTNPFLFLQCQCCCWYAMSFCATLCSRPLR